MAKIRPITAFVNPVAGTAMAALEALGAQASFTVCEVEPSRLTAEIEQDIANGARRVLVCGGDGTIAAAASVLAGSGLELAILPGGTLNHFARDHGIPTAADEALALALTGEAQAMDVGYVNDRLFLNTSSVGAYVAYVRLRERLERWAGYRLASLAAAARMVFSLPRYDMALELEHDVQHYATPLLFVGVGERELAMPLLGSRAPGGRSALHAIVVSGRAPARVLALALSAVARGVEHVQRNPRLDSFLLESFTVERPGRAIRVAVDGELTRLRMPLHYRLARGALRLVMPPPEETADTT